MAKQNSDTKIENAAHDALKKAKDKTKVDKPSTKQSRRRNQKVTSLHFVDQTLVNYGKAEEALNVMPPSQYANKMLMLRNIMPLVRFDASLASQLAMHARKAESELEASEAKLSDRGKAHAAEIKELWNKDANKSEKITRIKLSRSKVRERYKAVASQLGNANADLATERVRCAAQDNTIMALNQTVSILETQMQELKAGLESQKELASMGNEQVQRLKAEPTHEPVMVASHDGLNCYVKEVSAAEDGSSAQFAHTAYTDDSVEGLFVETPGRTSSLESFLDHLAPLIQRHCDPVQKQLA